MIPFNNFGPVQTSHRAPGWFEELPPPAGDTEAVRAWMERASEHNHRTGELPYPAGMADLIFSLTIEVDNARLEVTEARALHIPVLSPLVRKLRKFVRPA